MHGIFQVTLNMRKAAEAQCIHIIKPIILQEEIIVPHKKERILMFEELKSHSHSELHCV